MGSLLVLPVLIGLAAAVEIPNIPPWSLTDIADTNYVQT
jgi:hypothetical protein